MFVIQLIFITATIAALVVFVADPKHYALQAAQALGFGFLVWHRDSGKYFYALTYKDALEWLACTYDSATIFSNFTKEALQIKIVQNGSF